jgi:hypothetical protein
LSYTRVAEKIFYSNRHANISNAHCYFFIVIVDIDDISNALCYYDHNSYGIADISNIHCYCDHSSQGIANVSSARSYCIFTGLVPPCSPTVGLSCLKTKMLSCFKLRASCTCAGNDQEGWRGVAHMGGRARVQGGRLCARLDWGGRSRWWRRRACMWVPPMSISGGSCQIWCGEARHNVIYLFKNCCCNGSVDISNLIATVWPQ